jgi:hypothetical protein
MRSTAATATSTGFVSRDEIVSRFGESHHPVGNTWGGAGYECALGSCAAYQKPECLSFSGLLNHLNKCHGMHLPGLGPYPSWSEPPWEGDRYILRDLSSYKEWHDSILCIALKDHV